MAIGKPRMGNYTCRDDPILEQTIENHMRMIVAAIRQYIVPDAILLRGSFGRDEGSVFQQEGKYYFLSDYEIDVVINTPRYRKLFRQLSRELTARLGVETSLRWVRPDFLVKQRIGPLVMGSAPVTISLYESRYGSQVLWGDDLVRASREINPAEISPDSGIYLVLNRMAESMYLMPNPSNNEASGPGAYYWVNKTILACGEALLLLWGQYHYLYSKRGRRFVEMAARKLNFLPDNGTLLTELFTRATRYKLAPDPSLYPETVTEAWNTAIPVIELVCKHLIEEVYKISTLPYSDFPSGYLESVKRYAGGLTALEFFAEKLLEAYRALRVRSLPPALLHAHLIGHIVYAITPLAFHSLQTIDPDILDITRQWLTRLGPLAQPAGDPAQERDYLQKMTANYWKVYCYG